MKCFTRSLQIADEVFASKKSRRQFDSTYLALLNLKVSVVYVKINELDNALSNYDRALQLNNKSTLSIESEALCGKAKILEKRSDFAQAAGLYTKALSIIADRIQFAEDSRNIHISLANLYLKTGDIAAAKRNADTALSLIHQSGEEEKQPSIYITLARISSHEKSYADAAAQLGHAIRIASAIRALEAEDEAWSLLSATYEAMHKPQDALVAYRNYIGIRDSIYNIEKAREITRMDIESAYNTRRIGDSVATVRHELGLRTQIREQRTVVAGAIAGIGLLLALSFFIYRNYSQQKSAATALAQANEKIIDEKMLSESLLLNILPENVARELKTNGSVQARLYDNVTVLFTDFIDFTLRSGRTTPEQLVEELHACFRAFDVITGKYNIEKIKTVGDAYIAVAGLPSPNSNHAADIVSAAREIRDFMMQRRKDYPGTTFDIRIGVNSGPVVAGIVGSKKFAYDIWGDTVNTTARMEQNCEPGRINISQATYELVKDQFACQYRGEIEAKGKGMLKMYYVE
jgi:class 3 adenylate cyclase